MNPAAGTYPVTADARALAACAEATQESFREFPYWLARFPERGEAFSTSDSAWLVYVSGEETDDCVRQVLWLGTVLAARGMPRLLLEAHLGRLADALLRHRPEATARADALRAAADSLRERRQELIPVPVAEAIAAGFERAVAAEPGAVPGCGRILVAAAADDADVPAAVGSLLQWLADPERFGPGWLTAVEAALHAALDARTDGA